MIRDRAARSIVLSVAVAATTTAASTDAEPTERDGSYGAGTASADPGLGRDVALVGTGWVDTSVETGRFCTYILRVVTDTEVFERRWADTLAVADETRRRRWPT